MEITFMTSADCDIILSALNAKRGEGTSEVVRKVERLKSSLERHERLHGSDVAQANQEAAESVSGANKDMSDDDWYNLCNHYGLTEVQ